MIKSAEFTKFSTFSLTKGSWRVTIVPKYLYLVQGGNIMSGNICVPQIGEFSEKKFEKILKQTYYDALVKEIDNINTDKIQITLDLDKIFYSQVGYFDI